jgi:hypothetical protein
MKSIGWILIVALALVGCGHDSDRKEATDSPAAAPESSATAEAEVPAVAAIDEESKIAASEPKNVPALKPVKPGQEATPGKPGAAVELKYEIGASPEVGQPLVIDFGLAPQAASPALRVMVSTSAGLSLRQTTAPPLERNVKAGSEYWHQVVVVPEQEGAFSVSVIATMGEGDKSLARTFSIPVVVGSASAASKKGEKPAPQVDATGQAIEPMPGQESR